MRGLIRYRNYSSAVVRYCQSNSTKVGETTGIQSSAAVTPNVVKFEENAISITGTGGQKEDINNSNNNLKFPWRSITPIGIDTGLLDKIRNLMAEGSFKQILRYEDPAADDDQLLSSFLQGSMVAFSASAETIFSLAKPSAGIVITHSNTVPASSSNVIQTDSDSDADADLAGVDAVMNSDVTSGATSESPDGLSAASDHAKCPIQYAVQDLTDIFDSKLSSFYFDAIAASKVAGLEVNYRLLSCAPITSETGVVEESNSSADDTDNTKSNSADVGAFPIRAMISKYQVLFNARRPVPSGHDVAPNYNSGPSSMQMIHYLGIFPFLVKDKSKFSPWFPPTTAREEEEPKKMVVRVWVDLLVKEQFYVQNKMTKAIVQGSTEPVDVVHTMLLECQVVMDQGENRQVELNRSDWTVVDIDNWCDDNQWWR